MRRAVKCLIVQIDQYGTCLFLAIVCVKLPCLTIVFHNHVFKPVQFYSGHMVTDTRCDDNDMQREIRNLFARSNILARRFAFCSVVDVKIA